MCWAFPVEHIESLDEASVRDEDLLGNLTAHRRAPSERARAV